MLKYWRPQPLSSSVQPNQYIQNLRKLVLVWSIETMPISSYIKGAVSAADEAESNERPTLPD